MLKRVEPKTRLLLLAFAAIYLIWGTTYLAMRMAVETIPPFTMAGIRFLIAGGATFAYLRWRGARNPSWLQWRSAAVIGCFLMVGGNGLVTWAEQEIPSGIAALVVATMPLWLTFFDWLIFGGARPGKQVIAGLVLGIVGIFLLLGSQGNLLSGQSGLDVVSLIVLFFAPVFWSLGSLQSRKMKTLPDNIFMSTALMTISGGAILLIMAVIFGEPWRFNPVDVSLRSVLAMFYLAIFGSLIALTAYSWLLKNVNASRVATYTYVNPVIAVVLGWLILGEAINWQTAVAVAIIVAAVSLVVTSPQKSGRSDVKKPISNPGELSLNEESESFARCAACASDVKTESQSA